MPLGVTLAGHHAQMKVQASCLHLCCFWLVCRSQATGAGAEKGAEGGVLVFVLVFVAGCRKIFSVKIGFFVTCLMNSMRPSAAFASMRLIEHCLEAGETLVVPSVQTCCGQVSFNSGDPAGAYATALQQAQAFSACDLVIVPSGSCGGMIQKHYPTLDPGEEPQEERSAEQSKAGHEASSLQVLAGKTVELCQFLVQRHFDPNSFDGEASSLLAMPAARAAAHEVAPHSHDRASMPWRVALHQSCSSLRETQSAQDAISLLDRAATVTQVPVEGSDECCGFGGTFCVKYPDISASMLHRKCETLTQPTDGKTPDMIVSADLGCLLNIATGLRHQGINRPCYHIAEVLAGTWRHSPAIGEDAPTTSRAKHKGARNVGIK